MKQVLFLLLLLIALGCSESSISPEPLNSQQKIMPRTTDEEIYAESLRDYLDLVVIPLSSESPEVINAISDENDLKDYLVDNHIDTTAVFYSFTVIKVYGLSLINENNEAYVTSLTEEVLMDFYYTSGIYPGGGELIALPCLAMFQNNVAYASQELSECLDGEAMLFACGYQFAATIALSYGLWALCMSILY